jgi:L-cysteate sulfo-lyase
METMFSKFPRVSIAHLPTPLEHLDLAAARESDAQIFVKRDDCTGLALGGNKTRKLEFTLGHALATGADTLITSGAWHSNHVRQTAAAAARFGLRCEVVLHDATHRRTEAYRHSGNLLLHGLFGARLHLVDDEDQATSARIDGLVRETLRTGHTPYVVPTGASDAIGSLGYAGCARELLAQFAALSIEPTAIVLATGSGGTHAGLLAGLRMLGSSIPVVGISVSEPRATKVAKVRAIIDPMLSMCGASPQLVLDRDIVVFDRYAGEGYAVPTVQANAALRMVAEEGGLLLDPVYTAKAMSGLLDLLGRRTIGGQIVFLHTGGTPALFSYADEFPVRTEAHTCA